MALQVKLGLMTLPVISALQGLGFHSECGLNLSNVTLKVASKNKVLTNFKLGDERTGCMQCILYCFYIMKFDILDDLKMTEEL